MKIYWHMTTDQYHEYKRVSDEMLLAAQDQDLTRYQEAESQFKALPGMPQNIHPELDLVVPVITDTPKIITIGSTHQ